MTVRRAFVLVFCIMLFWKPVGPTLDPDMGWHLQTGAYILDHGIPQADVFSFTARGQAWTTHEWLSEAFMAGLYRLGGLPVLMLAFAAIVALTFILMYRRSVGKPYLAAFVTVLGAFASGPTWGVRPQMFNMLGTALFVYVVEGVRDGKLDRRAFLVLPLLTAVWANLHSGYLLGIVLLAVYVAGEALNRRFGPADARTLDWQSIRWLGAASVACFAAALLNPHGYRLWIYPFETLTSNAMQTYIDEWHSPDFHQPQFWFFGLNLLVGVVVLIKARTRPNWTDLLLFVGTGAAGLMSARHIQIFAVVAIPIIARYLLSALESTRLGDVLAPARPLPPPRRRMALFHWAIVALVALGASVDISRTVRSNAAKIARTYPEAAVDFIQAQGWEERPIFNHYNWGGYLIWRGLPVFIDGRADLYGDAFMHYYVQTLLVKPDWREALDDNGVATVLIQRGSALSAVLGESSDWREAYRDDLAQIFERIPRDDLAQNEPDAESPH
jgi:hypothetical protein